MKLSTVFEKVRESLQIGEQKYICTALEHQRWWQHIPNKDYTRALKAIHDRMEMKKFRLWISDVYYMLDDCVLAEPSLEWWLVWKGHITADDTQDLDLQDVFQAYRLAWVDVLIAEFKAKGD